jgi:hypothetical protein
VAIENGGGKGGRGGGKKGRRGEKGRGRGKILVSGFPSPKDERYNVPKII